MDLLLRHCPVAVFTAPLLRHCANLQLPVLALAIAAADQMESHNLQVGFISVSISAAFVSKIDNQFIILAGPDLDIRHID